MLDVSYNLQLIVPDLVDDFDEETDLWIIPSKQYVWVDPKTDVYFNRALAIAELDGVDKVLSYPSKTTKYNHEELSPSSSNAYGTKLLKNLDTSQDYNWDDFIRAYVMEYHLTPLEYMSGKIPEHCNDSEYKTRWDLYTQTYGCPYTWCCNKFKENCVAECELTEEERMNPTKDQSDEFIINGLIAKARIH